MLLAQENKRISILNDRAKMLRQARLFFEERGVIEVDCPLLSPLASVDAHIDLIPAKYAGTETCYLHSSPEYGMKRLLSEGIGDIYQLSHVFRDGELGRYHNPEFMMAEWYRKDISFEEMIQETADFIRLFIGEKPLNIISYREALLTHIGIDYVKASIQEMQNILSNYDPYLDLPNERDDLLNLLLGLFVEPKLGKDGLSALAYYPASQAALAKTKNIDDEFVAERFEIYFQGVELANGYHELLDVKEQKKRLKEANLQRETMGKNSLPIDDRFLEALENGLPDSCGVAVGFDRLMMLRHQTEDLASVVPFAWTKA
ncbi:MAG: EF-P lysine aminoacylase GenX [Waddliaceae bacterium]|nr:EF-P lysine aminoacylase GenX [Waddliaceae bacterium]